MTADSMLQQVYDELRSMACQILAHEKPGHTLQPTALVHEAYLKMRASYPQVLTGDDRRAFFACASEAMRRIIVDSVRRRKAFKRGGSFDRIPLEEAEFSISDHVTFDPEDLSDALNSFATQDQIAAEVVKLKYFVGMNVEEIAGIMNQSVSTTNRQWRYAKAWLKDFLDNRQKTDTE